MTRITKLLGTVAVLVLLLVSCGGDPYATVKAGCKAKDPRFAHYSVTVSAGGAYSVENMIFNVPMRDTTIMLVLLKDQTFDLIEAQPFRIMWGESVWGPWHPAGPWITDPGYGCITV